MGNENADYFLVSPDAATREAVAGATGWPASPGGVARRIGSAGDDLCRTVRAREVVGSLTPAGNKVYEFLHIPGAFRRLRVAAEHAPVVTKALVDDGAHNFCGFGGYGIVFDEPWNQHFHGLPNLTMIRRAKGWLDVARVLKVGLPFLPLGADAAAGAA